VSRYQKGKTNRDFTEARGTGTGTGKEDGSISGLMSAGPRGSDGIPERPSCKYPSKRQ